ncbi:hypothetical protein G3N58_16765 [Paraburkholderia sp. Ac-20342]|uniref:hypothetical protein n=1 Tax=Paraburkholderia sp. Ac-20342 TaxID=2703889 RepID=UPI00197D88C6|nr:hypothetical protein [Paraburkholderia sp. Ac-20342]MBN3848466.1 hypothetical protein [Paraburkholderia sp. Ac-20342]
MRLVFRSAPINRTALFAIREAGAPKRQRGGAAGMPTVAATPQRPGGSHQVTLWDEIAPPAPPPVPVDAMHAGESNAATYRKA